MKKFCLAGFFILIVAFATYSQTTLYFQGGEGTCQDNWGFAAITNAGGSIPPGIVTVLPRTGTRSIRAAGGSTAGCSGGVNCIASGGATGCGMHGNTITFNTVTVTGYSNVQLTFYHRSHTSCSGSGFDSGDNLVYEVSLNGGAYTSAGTLITGSGDMVWGYTLVTYNVPAGTNTFAFRVRATINRSDEVFYVDDVRLTTTSAIGSVTWNGSVSTDWFCAGNWTPPVVPVSTTSVIINQSASNDCVVGSAGAVCANIALSSNNGTTRNLTVQNSGTLVCGGDVTITKTVTNANLKLTLLNSATFTCNNLTLTGTASGAENAQLENESGTSVLATVNGNMIINNGGKLDLTNSPTYGILHIKGDYINNGLETDFKQTGSFVHFDGTGTQNINTNNFTEVFSNLVVNKSSGTVFLQDHIEVEQQLNMQNGALDLNAKTATIDNNATTGVIRTSGYVISENTSNLSKVIWQMGNTTGPHVFPFGKAAGSYIPFTFNLTAGTIGNVTISTYSTAGDNTPYPTTPNSVNDVDDYLGNDNSANIVDRFWQIDKTGASGTATLTFTYDNSEVPANGEGNLVAQRYADNPVEGWDVPLTGQSANAAANTVTVPGVTTFSPWTLSNDLLVLPLGLLDFRGIWLSKTRALLNWQVTSQIDVDHYLVEKSVDGNAFSFFGTVAASGGRLDYSLGDHAPSTINYYHLFSVDKSGYKKLLRTIVLLQPDEISDIIETRDVFYIMDCTSCKAEIIDISGKVIQFSAVEGNYEYNKQSLQPGIYFLRLLEGERLTTKKFIVF